MISSASIAARARGMVLGNIVGDAAAVPNHWVYDPVKMAELVGSATRGPAFCDPAGNGFYHTEPGGVSCYADQTLCLLESLVASKGFDDADYARRLGDCFGKSSIYELNAVDPANWPQLKTNPKDADGKIIEDQRVWTMPLPGPWRHGSIKGFLTNYVTKGLTAAESGSDDGQIDGCCKVPPLVALYAGDPALLPTVDRAVRVTQNTDTAASFACGFARILESLVLGKATSVKDACDQARAALRDTSRSFVSPMDADVEAALGLVDSLANVSTSDVGVKVQESLALERTSTALA